MSFAGRVHVRSLLAAGLVAAAAGVGWRVLARRPAPLASAWMISRVPADPLVYVPTPGPGHRSVSPDLPPWFGRADAPAVRIAGAIHGAPRPRTVHLSIEAPDPAIWTGRNADVAADGSFDFGPMRPGVYRLSATVRDLRATTPVDTLRAPFTPTALTLEPCAMFTGTLLRDSRPVANAAIEDTTGQVIATSDATGQFRACRKEYLGVRTAADDLPRWVRAYIDIETFDLGGDDTAIFTGKVVDGDGAPAAFVGVQPVTGDPGAYCHDAPVVVTTDARGRFSFASWPRLCGVRILRRGEAYEAPLLPSGDESLLPPLPPPPPPPPTWVLDESSPILRAYVVDPIEIRAEGDGPLEWVIRLARPQPKHGERFLQLAATPRYADEEPYPD